MRPTSIHHRCPRAGLDPIDGERDAVDVIALATHRPPRDETIAIVLDGAGCGIAIVVVAGTTEPDAVLDVAEFLTESMRGDERAAGLIIASVRASRRSRVFAAGRTDVDRWLEMSTIADDAGLRLVEWFVLDERLRCPRDLLGEPPRWSTDHRPE